MVECLGLQFPHPVGLAAGLDKNGAYLNGLKKPGFSFIELGTVTPRAQAGNPKPRLFRLPEAKALINRMGFDNLGVDQLIHNIKMSSYQGILGINIGKNRETTLEKAVEDYLFCFKKVYPFASYVTINISSPNTPGLRALQQENYLGDLIYQLKEMQGRLADLYQKKVPLLFKLSPDEDNESLKRITAQLVEGRVEGIVATNTTANHQAVLNLKYGKETGGLSGQPLFEQSTACLRLIKSIAGKSLTLIAAGGIDSPEKAAEKLKAGASLLQVYTGFIYCGPGLVHKLVSKI